MQCDQCGTTLPTDAARFCARCGAPLEASERKAPPAQSADHAAPSSDVPPAAPVKQGKKPLREQLAFQPSVSAPSSAEKEKMPAPATVQEVSDQVQPAEDKQELAAKERAPGDQGEPLVEKEGPVAPEQAAPGDQQLSEAPVPEVVKPRQSPVAKPAGRKRRQEIQWPAPMTHVAIREDGAKQEQDQLSIAQDAREERTASPVPSTPPAAAVETPAADAPRRELHVKIWKPQEEEGAARNEAARSSAGRDLERGRSVRRVDAASGVHERERAEEQPTNPLPPTELPRKEVAIPETPAPREEDIAPALTQVDTMHLGAQAHSRNATPLPPGLRAGTRPPRALLLLAVLISILVLGGLGLWIGLSQPFSVSPVTQPWQSYHDPSLGLSMVYPTDWKPQVDRSKSIVQFNDSSHTAQVVVAVSNASSESLDQLVQQQAKQFGLTTTRPAPALSFGGATWQQLQGNTQISGANYSGRILSTTHGSRHYVIVQLAPLDTYSDEERVIFSPMHASWKFQ